jgi:hypothetical protein
MLKKPVPSTARARDGEYGGTGADRGLPPLQRRSGAVITIGRNGGDTLRLAGFSCQPQEFRDAIAANRSSLCAKMHSAGYMLNAAL